MPACSLVRGTRTRQPNSGLVSNHDSVSRRSTTGPTTVTAGGVIFAARASAAMRASVETTVSWVVSVPVRSSRPGCSSSRPAAISSASDVADGARPRRAAPASGGRRRPPSELGVAAGHHRHLAVVLGGQRDAGVRRDRGDRGDARHDLEADAGLGARRGLLGRRRRRTGRPTSGGRRACRVLAVRTTTLAREACVSGWPSSPKPPSTKTGPTCRLPPSAARGSGSSAPAHGARRRPR